MDYFATESECQTCLMKVLNCSRWKRIAENIYTCIKDSAWPLLHAAMDLYNTRVSVIVVRGC